VFICDITFNPPLDKAGKYSFFEVAGTQTWQAVKTYSAGRITGMRYDNGNPILMIGNSFSVPMSQLLQIRG
jgi:flagellar basal-body rod modification protein FlgD